MWRKLTLVYFIPVAIWAQIEIQKLHLVTAPAHLTYYHNANSLYEGDDIVKTAIVLEARIAPMHSITYLTPINNLILDNDTISSSRCEKWERFSRSKPLIKWFLILPEKLDTIYRNSGSPKSPWANVRYIEIPIKAWENKWEVRIDELPNKKNYLPGTIWLKAAVAFQGQYVASPGIDSKYRLHDGQYYGGLSPAVRRITIKGSTRHPFVDHLLALRNLPYIENAASWNSYWADHQTKCWIGGNNHSFYQIAAELAGRSLLRYFNQIPIPAYNHFQLTTNYSEIVLLEEQVYRRTDKSGIYLTKNNFGLGDFILKGNLEAVLIQDRNPFGEVPNQLLDSNDLVVCWLKGRMELAPLAEILGDSLLLIRWVQRW